LGPRPWLGGDGPAAAGREPLPHPGRRAGLRRLADLWPDGPGLRPLRLALSLRFLLRLLDVGAAPPLEPVVAGAAQAALPYGGIAGILARPSSSEASRSSMPTSSRHTDLEGTGTDTDTGTDRVPSKTSARSPACARRRLPRPDPPRSRDWKPRTPGSPPRAAPSGSWRSCAPPVPRLADRA